MEIALAMTWLGLILGMIPLPKKKPVAVDFTLNADALNTPQNVQRTWDYEWNRKLAIMLFAFSEFVVVLLALKMLFSGQYLEMARESGHSTQIGLTALSIAGGLTFLIFVGFYVMMKTLPLMKTRTSYAFAWIFGLIFCSWAVGTSAWYSFMGTSGQQALGMYLVDTVNRLSDAANNATSQLKAGRGMPEAMEAKAAGFSTRQVNELTTGGGTGARGVGPVSQTLEGAAAVLTKGAAGIREALAKADHDAAELRARVKALQVLVSGRGMKVLDRETEMQKGAAEVQAMVAAMNDTGLVETVKATLVAMRSSVAELPAENSALGNRQRETIASVRADMQGVAGALEGFVTGLEMIKSEVTAQVGMVSLTEIAWDYKHRFVPQLIIAIGIELFAPWSLAWLAIYALEGGRPTRGIRVEKFLDLEDAAGTKFLTPDVMRKLPQFSAGLDVDQDPSPSGPIPQTPKASKAGKASTNPKT